MEKKEFIRQYVLARASIISSSPDIPGMIKNGEMAWNMIEKIGIADIQATEPKKDPSVLPNAVHVGVC